MKRILLFLISISIIFAFCDESNQDNTDPEKRIEELMQQLNETIEQQDFSDEEAVVEEENKVDKPYYQFNEKDSSGLLYAKFESASLVEGSVGLHFIDNTTGKKINFYHIDIDPEEEGLFTYRVDEDSFFPEIIPNSDILDKTIEIYWEFEYFQADLTDEKDYYRVLKSIDIINYNK